MFRSTKSLKGFSVNARDGNIGSLSSLHFDDQSWDVSYLVVELGKLINTKKVLILPTLAHNLSWFGHYIKVDLTRDQVKNSLPFHEDLPISYKKEYLREKNFEALHIADSWTGSLFPLWFSDTDKVDEAFCEQSHKNLRSTVVVGDYKVIDKDAKQVGKVKDFILDDESWKIKYLVIDTNGIYPFGDVLLSTFHIDGFNTDFGEISIDIDKNQLEICPKYDSKRPINREYTIKYYDYQGRLINSSERNFEEYDRLDMKLSSSKK